MREAPTPVKNTWWRRRPRWGVRGLVLRGNRHPLAAYAGCVLVGCSSGSAGSDCGFVFQSTAQLNIATWWATEPAAERDWAPEPAIDNSGVLSEGELLGAQSLEDGYRMCIPEGDAMLTTVLPIEVEVDGKMTLVVGKEATLTQIEQQGAALVADRAAPLEYQGAIVNGGADMFRLACRNGPDSALESLGTLTRPLLPFLGTRTPDELSSLVTCSDGQLYGIVLGLHQLNRLFYNDNLLRSIQRPGEAAFSKLLRGEADTQRLLEVLERVATDVPLPFVVDGRSWSWSLLVIENLMVAREGREAYESFWSRLRPAHFGGHYAEPSTEPIDLTAFDAALDYAQQLAPYIRVVEGAQDFERTVSCEELAPDCGVFFVMGDWATPSHPEQVKSVPFPGTADAYVYTADVAVVTRRPEPLKNTDPVLGWLKAISSAEVQTDYCAKKHCLSVVTTENGVTRARSKAELFASDGQVLQGVGGLPTHVPPESFDELETKVKAFMEAAITNAQSPSETSESARNIARQSLTDYVHEQYCIVLSQNRTYPDDCPSAPIQRPTP